MVSPGQFGPEMAAKARRWLTAGVQLVWVVWPTTRTVDVWRSGDTDPMRTAHDGELLTGEPALPGFTLPIADVFG